MKTIKQSLKTYIWLNCHGVDIVGIGSDKTDAFLRLNHNNRGAVLFCDKSVEYSQYPTTKRLFHNQVIKKY
jgi:hypothetical protein